MKSQLLVGGSCVALCALNLMVSIAQDPARRVIEAEEFRLMQDGKAVWSVKAVDGGVAMAMSLGGSSFSTFVSPDMGKLTMTCKDVEYVIHVDDRGWTESARVRGRDRREFVSSLREGSDLEWIANNRMWVGDKSVSHFAGPQAAGGRMASGLASMSHTVEDRKMGVAILGPGGNGAVQVDLDRERGRVRVSVGEEELEWATRK